MTTTIPERAINQPSLLIGIYKRFYRVTVSSGYTVGFTKIVAMSMSFISTLSLCTDLLIFNDVLIFLYTLFKSTINNCAELYFTVICIQFFEDIINAVISMQVDNIPITVYLDQKYIRSTQTQTNSPRRCVSGKVYLHFARFRTVSTWPVHYYVVVWPT